MHIDDLKPGEITYTHQDPDTGEYRTFAIDRIDQWLKENPELAKSIEYIVPVDQDFAEFISNNRGIEIHRIFRLFQATTIQPIIIAKMPDNTCLIIDGNHRYVVAAAVKAKGLPAYILDEEHWKPFIIEGISKELAEFVLKADSGIN